MYSFFYPMTPPPTCQPLQGGTGWPSFWAPVSRETLLERTDPNDMEADPVDPGFDPWAEPLEPLGMIQNSKK